MAAPARPSQSAESQTDRRGLDDAPVGQFLADRHAQPDRGQPGGMPGAAAAAGRGAGAGSCWRKGKAGSAFSMVAGLKLQSRNAIELVPGRIIRMSKQLSLEAKLERTALMAAAIKAHLEAAAAHQARDKAYAEAFEKAEAARMS
jgi:hypothetical protein